MLISGCTALSGRASHCHAGSGRTGAAAHGAPASSNHAPAACLPACLPGPRYSPLNPPNTRPRQAHLCAAVVVEARHKCDISTGRRVLDVGVIARHAHGLHPVLVGLRLGPLLPVPQQGGHGRRASAAEPLPILLGGPGRVEGRVPAGAGGAAVGQSKAAQAARPPRIACLGQAA